MRAEDKLEEAKHFLDVLKKMSRTITADSQWMENRDVHAIEPKFKPNFSACVQALRSVVDVLLYDYYEKYFKSSPERKCHMTEDKFSKKASTCGSPESKQFIEWYCQKLEELKGDFKHLFSVRTITVHRGGSWMNTKLKDTCTITKEGTRTEKEIYIAGMPETVAVSELERMYLKMDEIVKEARKKFQ